MAIRRGLVLMICGFLLISGLPAFADNPFGDEAVTQAGKAKNTPVAPAKAKPVTKAPPAKSAQKGPIIPEKITIPDILIAFQDVDLAVVNYREYEELNSRKNAGFFAAAGFTAAGVTLDKKRKFLDLLITSAKPEDLPKIDEIRKAYQGWKSCMTGYLTAAGVGGVLSGPNARSTTPSYLLLIAASAKFKSTLSQMQKAAITKSAEQNSALKQAEQAEKAAYDKLQELIRQGADGAAVKAAAKEYDDAKKTLEALK